MSAIDNVLSRLERVRQTGPDRWVASCPSHDDRNPSLNVKVDAAGKVIYKCQAGCHQHEVVQAIGLEFSDLWPDADKRLPPEKRPFPSPDVFRALADQILLIGLHACDLKAGKEISDKDHEAFLRAVGHVQAAIREGGFEPWTH